MARLTTFLALLALCLFPFSAAVTADDSPELGILKAKIRFGAAGRGASLVVKGAFDPSRIPGTFDPESGGLSVSIGPATVMSLPPIDPRATWKFPKPAKFVYLLKKTREEPDSLKLVVDTAKGRFCLKGRRIDLEALKAAGPEDVTITVTIDGTAFSKTITMGSKDGQWRFRYVPGSGGWPPGIPGIGPGGGGGGGIGGGIVTFRILAQGSYMGLTTFTTAVARTESDYYLEWRRLYPPPPPGVGAPIQAPPRVDFANEIVVVIDLGMRMSGGYSVDIRKASALGTGMKIEWVENKPGSNCVVTAAITKPYVIAAVSRRDGAVSFNGSVRTINCP